MLFAAGLMLIALLTPWSVPVRAVHWPQVFGWQSPVSVVAIGAMALLHIPRLRRYAVAAAFISGVALLAWLGWIVINLRAPIFLHSGFPFLPIDLLGEGWYIAALALAVTVDGMAVLASSDERPASAADVWPFAIVPGMGLVRMHYQLRGRLWFLGFAAAIFLLQTNAAGVEEFQYYASLGGLPPDRPRTGAAIAASLVLLVWILSLVDTRARLRLETTADGSAGAMGDRRESSSV